MISESRFSYIIIHNCKFCKATSLNKKITHKWRLLLILVKRKSKNLFKNIEIVTILTAKTISNRNNVGVYNECNSLEPGIGYSCFSKVFGYV